MNWKIGDRAIVDVPGNGYHGQECIIISSLKEATTCKGDRINKGELVHRTDLKPTYTSWVVMRPNELRPIPDDKHKRFHKALIASQWSDCVWSPMVNVENYND